MLTNTIDRLRQAYQAWHDTRGSSVTAWLELMADDVALGSLAGGAEGLEFSRPRSGRAEVEHYLGEITRDWEMLSFHMHEFITQGDRVVALGRCSWRHRTTGKTVDSPAVHVWRFREGLATEFFEFFDTAAAQAAAQPG